MRQKILPRDSKNVTAQKFRAIHLNPNITHVRYAKLIVEQLMIHTNLSPPHQSHVEQRRRKNCYKSLQYLSIQKKCNRLYGVWCQRKPFTVTTPTVQTCRQRERERENDRIVTKCEEKLRAHYSSVLRKKERKFGGIGKEGREPRTLLQCSWADL